MPLTDKGKKIMRSMKKKYGSEKGESVFYASRNKGTISGVEKYAKGTVPDKGAKRGKGKKEAGRIAPRFHNLTG